MTMKHFNITVCLKARDYFKFSSLRDCCVTMLEKFCFWKLNYNKLQIGEKEQDENY